MQNDPLSDLLNVRLLSDISVRPINSDGGRRRSFSPQVRHSSTIFPRTSHVAKYHGVAEAARLVHDESLSVGSYHLFRLPEELAAWACNHTGRISADR